MQGSPFRSPLKSLESPHTLVTLTEVHHLAPLPLFQGRGLVGIEGAAPLSGLSLADKERPELPVPETWKLSCSISDPSSWIEGSWSDDPGPEIGRRRRGGCGVEETSTPPLHRLLRSQQAPAPPMVTAGLSLFGSCDVLLVLKT